MKLRQIQRLGELSAEYGVPFPRVRTEQEATEAINALLAQPKPRKPEKPKLERPNPRKSKPVASGWSALLDREDVLIVDTETIGISNQSEVIEVAVLDTTGTEPTTP